MAMDKYTVTLTSEIAVAAALAAADAGKTVPKLIETALVAYLKEKGLLDLNLQRRMQLRAELTSEISAVAAEIVEKAEAEGLDFPSDVILETIDICTKRKPWEEKYKEFLGVEDIFAHGIATKIINRDFGLAARKASGGKVKCNDEGEPIMKRAKNAIIQTYTVLEKAEPALVD